jgi:hypothetical protein
LRVRPDRTRFAVRIRSAITARAICLFSSEFMN